MSNYLNKHAILLFLLVFVTFLSRAYMSSVNPSILNRDEAALAYNALLLQQTGKDEWGRKWPLILESFGDFKLIGYPAVLSLIYPAFPLDDGLVRLPSLVAGSLLLVVAFYFIRYLKLDDSFSLLAALAIATAPFSIFYSKMAYEANLGLTLFSGAIVIALLNQKNSVSRDVITLFLFLLASLTYNTPFLLLPFVLVIVILNRGLLNWKKWGILSVGSAVLFVFFLTQLHALTQQKRNITIFSDELHWEQSIRYREQFTGILQPVLGNKYIFFAKEITDHTINSFSPKFLISQGGNHPWHSLPDWGHMYLVSYVFGIVGVLLTFLQLLGRLIYEVAEKKTKNTISTPLSQSFTGKRVIILLLLFASLAPSIVTVDAPHATRSLLFLFLFHIFAVLGIYDCIVIINTYIGSSQFWKKIESHVVGIVAVSLIIFASFYLYEYHLTYPEKQKHILKSGFNTVIAEVDTKYPDKKIAVVDDEGYHYILAAWYLKMDPQQYFDTVVRQLPNQISFRYGEQVGRFHFIAHESDRSDDEPVLVYFDGSQWQVQTF